VTTCDYSINLLSNILDYIKYLIINSRPLRETLHLTGTTVITHFNDTLKTLLLQINKICIP